MNDRPNVLFVRKIDDSLKLIERYRAHLASNSGSEALIAEYDRLIVNLRNLRDAVEADKLAPSSRGASGRVALGYGRFVGEYCNDEQILRAMHDIDEFYLGYY